MPEIPDIPNPKRRELIPSDPYRVDVNDTIEAWLNQPEKKASEVQVPPEFSSDIDPDKLTQVEIQQYRAVLLELSRRKIEALRLYEPLPKQQAYHEDTTRIKLLRGSNRAGKTLVSAVEFSRIVCGVDPMRRCTERDGRAFIVGKDLNHIGTVIHRKLFRSGAFKIIRDEHTKEWRAFRPWLQDDIVREKEAKPAPPLIPTRMIAKVAWEKKSENVPAMITLKNGWEINFYSSLGKPPQGSDLDYVWFDEEIVDGEWFPEMMARLLDRNGHFEWSATPQTGTDRLYELHLRCEREHNLYMLGGQKPTATEHHILLADNKHISDDNKRTLAASYTDREYDVRIGGEFAIESSRVWPEYSTGIHVVDFFDIPTDATKYAIIDPGRQICAVLFAACLPPGFELTGPNKQIIVISDEVILYDELYIPNSDATIFGTKMLEKCRDNEFEAFIIDTHGGRITEAGSGKTVESQYRAALEANGIKSHRTGSGFAWGSDDVQGGLLAVRQMLKVKPSGNPRLMVVRDKLPNFEWEIARYRYKRINNIPTDEPESRGRVHLMANVRYLSLYGPTWVAPLVKAGRATGAVAAFLEKQRRKKKNNKVILGPAR